MSRRRIATWLATWLGCLGTLSIGMAVHADEALDDLGGRMEYAFYVADSRGLQQSWQQLDKLQVGEAESALRNSYLNYGRWKTAQLLATDNPGQAQQFAQACAESKPAAKSPTLLATQHALIAACYGMLEMLRPVRRVLYRNDRQAALQQALHTSGNAPQVLFIAAWLGVHLETDHAHELLSRAFDGFGAAGNAGWGYAETCYLLGKLELARGNVLAARNALEQALVQAPDYGDARRLLQSLSVK